MARHGEGRQAKVLEAVKAGADTIKEVSVVLPELTGNQISAHLSNLRKRGLLRVAGTVKYPGQCGRVANRYKAIPS